MLGLQQHIKYTTSLASQAMYQVRGNITIETKDGHIMCQGVTIIMKSIKQGKGIEDNGG